MKYFLMYFVLLFIVACADSDCDYGDNHSFTQKIIRAVFWPITITSWFKSQNGRMHRLLNILWCMLIGGWLLSLISDRF